MLMRSFLDSGIFLLKAIVVLNSESICFLLRNLIFSPCAGEKSANSFAVSFPGRSWKCSSHLHQLCCHCRRLQAYCPPWQHRVVHILSTLPVVNKLCRKLETKSIFSWITTVSYFCSQLSLCLYDSTFPNCFHYSMHRLSVAKATLWHSCVK